MSMNAKKRVNGSWVNTTLRQYKTATDTITTFPAVLYTTGTTATVVLKGQAVQPGTPSLTSSIMPKGCGERTGNLFDGLLISGLFTSADFNTSGNKDVYKSIKVFLPAGTYTFSFDKNVNIVRLIIDGNYSQPVYTDASSYTITSTTDGYVGISFRDKTSSSTIWDVTTPIMLNEGSTPLPYEPYGYKILISSANTTTPVYLGEVESTRQIKKLVLTGDEWWQFYSDDLGVWQFYINNISLGGVPISSCMSNIAPYGVTVNTRHRYDYGCYLIAAGNGVAFQTKGDKDTLIDTASWKSYLAAKYAAGTPVTVWYVLANEETAVVNEPLMKIGDYADKVSNISIPTITGKNIVDVETVLKPSEVSFNYAGWHTAVVHKRINGAWD